MPGSDEPLATERPSRDEYPERSLSDLVTAIERALADDDWAHHVAGRYTAHRTYTEHDPDTRPGDKHVAVRVIECEREIILNIPEEHADSVLTVLKTQLRTASESSPEASRGLVGHTHPTINLIASGSRVGHGRGVHGPRDTEDSDDGE